MDVGRYIQTSLCYSLCLFKFSKKNAGLCSIFFLPSEILHLKSLFLLKNIIQIIFF